MINALKPLKQFGYSVFGRSAWLSCVNILEALPLFAPFSSGDYESRARLTLDAANQVFPILSKSAVFVTNSRYREMSAAEFVTGPAEEAAAKELKQLLDVNQSDKASRHNYHLIYGTILSRRNEIVRVAEIGLGTHHTDVVSSMGKDGKPGASLRAFRDFCPRAHVSGADIDRRVLFQEERIKTVYIDQTRLDSFNEFARAIGGECDLFIDDGLHSPAANLNSLNFGLGICKVGGWVVIEDIAEASRPLWQFLGKAMHPRFAPTLINADDAIVFAVQRDE